MILAGARTEKFDFEIKTLIIITLCKEEINFDAFLNLSDWFNLFYRIHGCKN